MLQPFKYITVVMKDRTNHGVTAFHDTDTTFMDRFELAGDLRYTPVTLDDDGLGVGYTDANKTRAMIGILMESFNKTNAQHKVLVHGIVPMKTDGTIKAGMYVYWDTATNRATAVKGDAGSNPFLGRSLTTGAANGDIIDVLIV